MPHTLEAHPMPGDVPLFELADANELAAVRAELAHTRAELAATRAELAEALRPRSARSRRPSCACGRHLRACSCGSDLCPGWQHQTTGAHFCAGSNDMARPVTNTEA